MTLIFKKAFIAVWICFKCMTDINTSWLIILYNASFAQRLFLYCIPLRPIVTIYTKQLILVIISIVSLSLPKSNTPHIIHPSSPSIISCITTNNNTSHTYSLMRSRNGRQSFPNTRSIPLFIYNNRQFLCLFGHLHTHRII